MTKEEWQKHCEWLNTFRGRIITNHETYKTYNKQVEEKEKD